MFLDIPTSIDPNSTNSFWTSNESWVIATGTNEAFLQNGGISVDNWAWDYGTFGLVSTNNNSELVLAYTAVPEPSNYALFGLGVMALVTAYRRRVS